MKKKFVLQDKDNTYFKEFMNKDNIITSKNKKDAKKFNTDFEAKEYKRTKLLHDFHVENFLSENVNFKKYSEFLNEDGEGGAVSSGGGSGVAFVSNSQNGMGNIVTPQVGTTTGSLWQAGSGTIGSGDKAAYDQGDHFGWKGDKFKKKGKRGDKNKKPKVITKFSQWITGPKN